MIDQYVQNEPWSVLSKERSIYTCFLESFLLYFTIATKIRWQGSIICDFYIIIMFLVHRKAT